MSTPALLLIDLQNDFSEIVDKEYFDNLRQLVHNAREVCGFPVIWVYSHYANDPNMEHQPWDNMDEMCERTHTGKSIYCKRGTPGADFMPELLLTKSKDDSRNGGGSPSDASHPCCPILDEAKDIKIKKTFYSAFTQTQLEKQLKKHHIHKLYIGGVTSSTCVKATSYNAKKLGYEVVACTDIMRAFGGKKGKKHLDSLETIKSFGIDLQNNAQVIDSSRRYGWEDKAVLHRDFVPTDLIDVDFDRIKNEVPWCEMISHGAPVPRLVCCQGTTERNEKDERVVPLYRHPVDCQPTVDDWTPAVKNIRDYISGKLGVNINHALIQLYRDTTDYIGEHSDKTLDIVPNTPILNFTIGATRHMLVKEKSKAEGVVAEKVPLSHNSLFEFDLVTNEKCRHEIRPNKRPDCEKTAPEKIHGGARISFTFRSIGTFFNTATGEITGQGARKDGDTSKEDCRDMMSAFSEENRSKEFSYDQHYGSGFNALYVTTMSKEFVFKRVELPEVKPNIPALHYVSGSVPSWKVEVMMHELGMPFEKKRERVMVQLSDKLAQLNWRQLTPTLVDVDGLVIRESWAILSFLDAFSTEAFSLFPSKGSSTGSTRFVYGRVMELAQAADDLLKKRFGPIEDILIKKVGMISDEEAHVKIPPLMAKFEEEITFWETHILNPDRQAEVQCLIRGGSAIRNKQREFPPVGGGSSTSATTTTTTTTAGGPSTSGTATAPSTDQSPPVASSFLVGDQFTIADISAFCNIGYIIHRGLPLQKYPNITRYYKTLLELKPCLRKGAPETWNLDSPDGPNIFQRYNTRCLSTDAADFAKRQRAKKEKQQEEQRRKAEQEEEVASNSTPPPHCVEVHCELNLEDFPRMGTEDSS